MILPLFLSADLMRLNHQLIEKNDPGQCRNAAPAVKKTLPATPARRKYENLLCRRLHFY